MPLLGQSGSRSPVLVTGASGFVGRWAVKHLQQRGIDVVGTSRRACAVVAPTHACDLLDPAAVDALFDRVKPRTVLHLAWVVEHGRFWSAPDNLDWVGTTLQLARTAARHGATRFVGTGTCFEYAFPTGDVCSESRTPLRADTLYGASKDAARRVLERFAHTEGFSFAWARLFYLYGPHEDPRRLVASVARRLIAGELAPISNGLAIRDFLDVRDAAAALAALALSDVAGAVNIASGEGIGVRALVERLAAIAGKPHLVQAGALPDRDEPAGIVADISRLRDEVGFTPTRDLDRGLAECYAWWRDQHAAL